MGDATPSHAERMREFERWLIAAVDELMPIAEPLQRARLRRIRHVAGGGNRRPGPSWMRPPGQVDAGQQHRL